MALTTIFISSLSTEYVKISLTGLEDGVIVDPTFGTIEFAFPLSGEDPIEADWISGSWETAPNSRYFGRCLVGPIGAITPVVGAYDVWIRADLDPELLIRNVGNLQIT